MTSVLALVAIVTSWSELGTVRDAEFAERDGDDDEPALPTRNRGFGEPLTPRNRGFGEPLTTRNRGYGEPRTLPAQRPDNTLTRTQTPLSANEPEPIS